MNLVNKNIVCLCLVAAFVNIGIQVRVGLDVVKLMFLLVDKDHISLGIFTHLVPEQTQYVALTNTSLSRQDDDGILTEIAFNLLYITLSKNRTHSTDFYLL